MPTSPARILVVDDEDAILETMTFTFQDEYEVLTAPSAERALALLEEHRPVAVVITDQRMPEMSGVEFLKLVCERHPETTRILLTGFADLDAIADAINQGHVYAYVAKPWEPSELKQLVRRAVEHHRLTLENERLLRDLREANLFLEAAMDEIPMGALAVDARGVVRAANRLAREYLGIEGEARGRPLDELLGAVCLEPLRRAEAEASRGGRQSFEECELEVAGRSLRLRLAVRPLGDPRQAPLGRVVLLREISHEPLRRRFEALLRELVETDAGLADRIRAALGELSRLRGEVERGIESPGMEELAEQISRALTALENWLAVDEALATEDFPDARLLRDRIRVAEARWPLGPELPTPVRELARRVDAYYHSGENRGERVL